MKTTRTIDLTQPATLAQLRALVESTADMSADAIVTVHIGFGRAGRGVPGSKLNQVIVTDAGGPAVDPRDAHVRGVPR